MALESVQDLLRLAEQMANDAMRRAPAAAGARGKLRDLARSAADWGGLLQMQRASGAALLFAVRALSSAVGKLDTELSVLRQQLAGRLPLEEGLDDASYLAFEEKFRGPASLVAEFLEIYEPDFAALASRRPGTAVFEIGTGRGELAQLVRRHGLRYLGSDTNQAMVDKASALGHEVLHGDGLEHLARQAPRSLGAVVAIHVIEHLPFSRLLRLLDLAAEKLLPNGMLILETPDITSVASFVSFSLDPTHIQRVHPLLLQFVVQRKGFQIDRCTTVRASNPLVPMPDSVPGAQQYNKNLEAIGNLLFGGHDRVLVARREDAP
jgi:O-antigen chain-terminating methyltransferase